MTSFLNIRIDGAAYGEEVVSKSKPAWELAPAVGIPGIPTAPATSSPEQNEPVKKAAAKDYENGVFKVLLQIDQTQSGHALIGEIHRIGRTVTIVPLIPVGQDWTGASARPFDETAATRKHWLKRDKDGDPYKDRERGTGAGSDCEIEFITSSLAQRVYSEPAIKTPKKKPNPLALADEILVHELLHAVRDMAGASFRRRVPRQPRYDNFEEFYAIVVANVYRSECGRSGVRSDNHSTFESMYVDGKGFLRLHFNRMHLQRFCRRHENLAAELSKISTYFNPFQHLRT